MFNQPNPNDSCEERVSESVAPGLQLLNSDFQRPFHGLALRTEKEFENLRMQVKRVVQLALGRVPEVGMGQLENHAEKMREYHLDMNPATYPTSIPVPSSRKPPACLSSTKSSPFQNYHAKKAHSQPQYEAPADCAWFFSTPTNLCTLTEMKTPLWFPQPSRFPLWLTSPLGALARPI